MCLCVYVLNVLSGLKAASGFIASVKKCEEEDTCMSYEEEDICMLKVCESHTPRPR
jgi:hypothetical protein